jgi:hypothetical protein
MSEKTQGDPEEYLRHNRFFIDEPTRQLIEAERKVLANLQTDAPELKGLAFMGSRLKGTHRPDSDLDSVLFYDSAELQKGRDYDDFRRRERQVISDAQSRLALAAGKIKLEISMVDVSPEATQKDLERFAKKSDITSKNNLIFRFYYGAGEEIYGPVLDKLSEMPDGEQIFKKLLEELSKHERVLSAREARTGPTDSYEEEITIFHRPPDIPYEGGYPKTIAEAREFFSRTNQ